MRKTLGLGALAILTALSFATINTAAYAEEPESAADFAHDMVTGGYQDVQEGLVLGDYQGPGRVYEEEEVDYGYYDEGDDFYDE